MDHAADQIDPALLRVGGEVDGDRRSRRRRSGDEDVLGRLGIGETAVRGVNRNVDHHGWAAAEIGADVGRQIAALGEDGDRLSRRQIDREIVELGDLLDRDRRGCRRIAKVALGDAAVVQSEDADDDVDQFGRNMDEAVAATVGLGLPARAPAAFDLVLVVFQGDIERPVELCNGAGDDEHAAGEDESRQPSGPALWRSP